MTIDARLTAGEGMVRHAGAMARKILASPSMRLDSKGPGDVVTEADLAIEDMVRREIAVRFPGDTVFGEEGGGAAAEAGFTWLVDPVDGTVNYARRLGYYCISLALLHDRRPVAAWIFDPVQDELFHAGPDQVMRVDGRPTRASCQTDLREGVVALGFSNRHAPTLGAAVVDAVLASGAEFRRLGAGALCLAHVAAGRLEGYLEPHMNPWDAVGGLYLAHCAGAVTGAYLEQGGLAGGAPVIALAPGFADALLALLPEPYSGTPLHRENDLRSAGLARYDANRLRVVRQVRYSLANENAIDLVLFLNGLPVATVELKTDFTQSVLDAVDQYRFDRHPTPKGQAPEPLLGFPGGALVHFAVSNAEVQMTTQLIGPLTTFLPFNKGSDGGKGNPPNPNGHPTAYLWDEAWQRDSWLEIIGRDTVGVKDNKKKLTRYVFPRYHQLDATRKLRAAVLAEGAGGKYLIQHSAGSGKTNSIAWSAHFLADLHDAKDHKVFDSVLVVSDRNVIDSQLQEAIFAFERNAGVVATIKSDAGAKSGQLAQALAGGKKIVVCTIQTFPFALAEVRDLAATQGKRFAVIADEAHSSQTGEAAAKLKAVLSPEELADLGDGGEVSAEDLLAAQMAARAADTGVTYVAFTATPKGKTLELFGRRPDPSQPAGPENLPAAFHVYSMRQAIEEGFILDVLQNYTPYSLAFKLANDGEEIDDLEVERSAALKTLMRWVRLHDYNISQKVQIVVEHYRGTVQPLLDGKAKAMVVVGSRQEAVRWQLAIQKYIREKGYKIGTLVAFSGEVVDKESGEEPFSETSKALNPGLVGDIRETFKLPDFHILLVANKFQTGFDQPLLCGMYVDRRLAGIQAVQTLSRLNRAHPGKDTTYVLDFANNAEEVLKAFKTYYDRAELENVTDPNLVFNLRAKLDALGFYDDHEVDRVVRAELNPDSKQSDLVVAIFPVADRLLRDYREAQKRQADASARGDAKAAKDAQDQLDALQLFRADMGAYVRLYAFLSQIFDYGNTAIEGRSIFFRRLIPLLEFGRQREIVDTSKIVLTHHKLTRKDPPPIVLGLGEKLQAIYEVGAGSVQEKERALLAEIIAKVNDLFQGDVSDDDQLIYVNNVLKGKLLQSETLAEQAANNTKEQFSSSPDLAQAIVDAVIDAMDAHRSMSQQVLGSKRIQEGIKDVLLGPVGLYEALRRNLTRPDA